MTERPLNVIVSEICVLENQIENTRKHYLNERAEVKKRFQDAKEAWLAKAEAEFNKEFGDKHEQDLEILRTAYTTQQNKCRHRLSQLKDQLSGNVVGQIMNPGKVLQVDDELYGYQINPLKEETVE